MTGNTENKVNEENYSKESYGEENSDFGAMLSSARKAQNYSISDINDNIKIPEEVLTALEACDLAALPASTYTQGYIRSYARFLEISEDRVLDLYHQALPASSIAPDIKLKTETPVKGTGKSPFKSMVPVYIIFAAIAIIYTAYHYSQDSADNQLTSEEAGDSINSQELSNSQPVEIEQNARMGDDGELVLTDNQESTEVVRVKSAQGESKQIESERIGSKQVESESAGREDIAASSTETRSKTDDATTQLIVSGKSDKSVLVPIPPKVAQAREEQVSEEQASEKIPEQSPQVTSDRQSSEDLFADEDEDFPDDQATANQAAANQASDDQVLSNQPAEDQLSVTADEDSITFYAEDGSWIEVLDANDRRLFYNMLPVGASKTLTGQAPFSITVGNAKTTHVQINNIDVDFSNRIRSSNTARFKVSNKGQRVILQR
jgi:cytoskeletal protein RodZ